MVSLQNIQKQRQADNIVDVSFDSQSDPCDGILFISSVLLGQKLETSLV